MNATGNRFKRLGKVGSNLHAVLITPDGLRAYVSGGHDESAPAGSNKMAVIDPGTL